MIKRILLGIGGTPFSAAAIEQAVALAAYHGTRLTAVTVVDPNRLCKLGPVPPGGSHYVQRLCANRLEVTRQGIDAAVADLEKSCKASSVSLDLQWETGNAFELLIDYARYHDLTIFGLRSLFEFQLAEHPEKDLIRLFSQGVRPIMAVSRETRPIRRVMIAYSGSVGSAKAMRHFAQSGLWPGADLEIVHCGSGSQTGRGLLNDAAAYCRDYGYTVTTRNVPGSGGDAILSAARDLDADLIVMGCSLRGVWLRQAMGDTVLETLTQTDRALYLAQ